MSLIDFLVLLFVAGICGSIAQSLVGFSRGGCLTSIVLGFIGAALGTYLARVASFPEILAVQIGGRNFPIIWSIIGAALFSAALALISGRRPRE